MRHGSIMARLRLYLVTFDLVDTVPGDPRYQAADSSLRMYGPVFRPLKQNRFIITESEPETIRLSLAQRIGSDCSVIVIPIRSVSSWNISRRGKRNEWRKLVSALNAANIQIAGISENYASQ